jgi:hypothetical protein
VASDGEERQVFGVKLSVCERRANGKNPPERDIHCPDLYVRFTSIPVISDGGR